MARQRRARGSILDDGKRLWLIDFEYSGPGDAIHAESADLLRAYFGPNDFAERHHTMELLSLLREGLWSLVSARHIHERDVDYRGYAETNFQRLREGMRDL